MKNLKEKITNFFTSYNEDSIRNLLWTVSDNSKIIFTGHYQQDIRQITLSRYQRKPVAIPQIDPEQLVIVRVPSHQIEFYKNHVHYADGIISGELYFGAGTTSLGGDKWIVSFPNNIVSLARLVNEFELNRDILGNVIENVLDQFTMLLQNLQMIRDLERMLMDFTLTGYSIKKLDVVNLCSASAPQLELP